MVADALHEVANHLGVEEADGQLHQLDEEVGDDADVDACADVEQYPRADELDGGLRRVERELRDEDERDEAEVSRADAVVHDALAEEGEDELQQGAEQHSHEQLDDELLVGFQVLQDEGELGLVGCFALGGVEVGLGFEEEGDAFVGALVAGAGPAVEKLLRGEFHQAVRRVGHKHGVFPDFVDHHEMPLFPVRDAGQGRFVFQLLEGEACPDGLEADALRRFADA